MGQALNKRTSQTDDVLNYLMKGKSLTHREVEDELGVMRLASRINELKKRGHKIKSVPEKVKARNGRSTYISRYSLC